MIPGIPPFDAPNCKWNMPEAFRPEYVSSKYEIAKRFQPKRICEIGVFSGIAAKCFLAASPDAEYIGMDNEKDQDSHQAIEDARIDLANLGYRATILIQDSQTITDLPGQFDFIHVDGLHSREGAHHDMYLAWNALTDDGHILIDNGHDMGVATGVFDALYELRYGKELIHWEYQNPLIGNIIIFKTPLVWG
jgi:predicted O-methyltransferase YrrM